METVVYLQLTQTYESESKALKVSGKAVAAAVTLASTTWAGGLLTAAPAMAYGYGCCRPVVHRPISCCRPVIYRPVSYCHQSCYYPQTKYKHYDSGSYYPDYYSKDYHVEQPSHDYSYDYSYDYSHEETSYHDYQEIAYHPATNPNFLKLGSSGDAVARLQAVLNSLGYDVGTVDGFYGPSTEAAVIHYQSDNGLPADGIAGEQTLGNIGILFEPSIIG